MRHLLDKLGIGDVLTLMAAEYRALSRRGQARYWLCRHPVMMFGLRPAWLFICQYQLPMGPMRSDALPWAFGLTINLGIVLPRFPLVWLLGLGPFLLIQLPTTLMAATAGL